MDEGTQGLFILGAMAISFSLAWHWFVKNYNSAVIGATVTTVIMFQVVAAIYVGYVDPFIIIAMIVSGAITVIVAAIVGIPFKAHRDKTNGAS